MYVSRFDIHIFHFVFPNGYKLRKLVLYSNRHHESIHDTEWLRRWAIDTFHQVGYLISFFHRYLRVHVFQSKHTGRHVPHIQDYDSRMWYGWKGEERFFSKGLHVLVRKRTAKRYCDVLPKKDRPNIICDIPECEDSGGGQKIFGNSLVGSHMIQVCA